MKDAKKFDIAKLKEAYEGRASGVTGNRVEAVELVYGGGCKATRIIPGRV